MTNEGRKTAAYIPVKKKKKTLKILIFNFCAKIGIKQYTF